MSLAGKQFTRLFAPRDVKNMILPSRIKDRFVDLEIIGKHFLFTGVAGTGKSTLADIISADYPRIKINCSVNGRIDDLRGRIDDFCSEASFSENGKNMKIVFFDEIDGVSDAFFEGLRGFMDKYEGNTKFIATCNYVHKITSPILSRFTKIDFNPTEEEEKSMRKGYDARLKAIISKLKMEVDQPTMDTINKKYFPDWRKPLQLIQDHYESKNLVMNNTTLINVGTRYKDLYDIILKPGLQPIKLHKEIIIKYQDRAMDVLESFHSSMVDYIIETRADLTNIIPNVTFYNAKYMHMATTGVDPVLALKSCIWEINKTIKS